MAAGLTATQPGQYAYPASSVHVTLVGPIDLNAAGGVAAVVADLGAVTDGLHGARLRVVGLRLGPTTVFAQIAVEGADLRGVRTTLRGRWGATTRTGLGGFIADRLFWSTLVRFTIPPDAAFVAAFERVRATRSDRFDLEAVELLRTNNVMAPAQTERLARVAVPTAR